MAYLCLSFLWHILTLKHIKETKLGSKASSSLPPCSRNSLIYNRRDRKIFLEQFKMRQHGVCKSCFIGNRGSWLILLKRLSAFIPPAVLGWGNFVLRPWGEGDMYNHSFHHCHRSCGCTGHTRPSSYLLATCLVPVAVLGRSLLKSPSFYRVR